MTLRKWLIIGGSLLAAGGAAVALAAIAVDPREALYGWHLALMFGTTTAIGALFWLMIGHSSNAGWFIVIRRPVEHVVGTLPLLALLFIPVLVFLKHLFPWAEGGIEMHHHVEEAVAKKRAYLNETAFILRTIGYLVALVTVGELLRHWSRQQERAHQGSGQDTYGRRMRILSSLGLPVLGMVVTMAFVDWMMSLQPEWYSTMFGPAVLAGGFVAAMGLHAIAVVVSHRWGDLRDVTESHRHAVGRMLFTSICFWGYLNFVQYLIIWIADLPEEVRFWIRRQELGWQWVGVAIILGHLVIPFFLLLSRRLKEIPSTLAFFGAWMVVFHLIATFYLIIPAHRIDLRLHWADPFAVAMVVGAMTAFALLRSLRMASVPQGDPRLTESRQYTSS